MTTKNKLLATFALTALLLGGCGSGDESSSPVHNGGGGDDPATDTSLSINTLDIKALAFYKGKTNDVMKASSISTATTDSSRGFKIGQVIKIDKDNKLGHIFNDDIKIYAFTSGDKAEDYILFMGDFTDKLAKPQPIAISSTNTSDIKSSTSDTATGITGIDIDKCTLIAVNKNKNKQKGYCLNSGDTVNPFDTDYRSKLSLPDKPVHAYDDNGVTKYLFLSKNESSIDIKEWDGLETINTIYQTTDPTLLAAKLGAATLGKRDGEYYFFIKDTAGNGVYIHGSPSNGYQSKAYQNDHVMLVEFSNGNMVVDTSEGFAFTNYDLYNTNIVDSLSYMDIAINPMLLCQTIDINNNTIEWFNADKSILYVSGYGSLCKLDTNTNNLTPYPADQHGKRYKCGNPCKVSEKLTLTIMEVTEYTDYQAPINDWPAHLASLNTIKYGVRYTDTTSSIDKVYLLGNKNNTDYIYTLDITNDVYDQTNILNGLNFTAVDSMSLDSNNLLVIKGTANNGLLTTAYFNPETLDIVQAPVDSDIITKPEEVK